MKFIAPFLLLTLWLSTGVAQTTELDKCDVVWTSQSQNSSQSMPCGGGDIGLNVWVENGDVLFSLRPPQISRKES